MIFVFGSNRSGFHGAGAAKYAIENKGAVMREGEGHFGDSYALPTKDHKVDTLPLHEIWEHVKTFLEYARGNPDLEFQVTKVGCGYAYYTDKDIAPMFEDAPDNCHFDEGWANFLTPPRKFWGRFD